MMASLVVNKNRKTKRKIYNFAYCVISCLMILLLPACQLTSTGEVISGAPPVVSKSPSSVDYGQYYLWLKTLDNTQLLAEINRIKAIGLNQEDNTSLKLILLQSVPQSPIFNPYSAKTKLNELEFNPHNNSYLNSKNVAFFVLLKDQLNEQILLLNQIQQVEDVAKFKVRALKSTLLELQHKISQLIKIEQNINEHGQKNNDVR